MKGPTPIVLMYHGVAQVPRSLDPANIFVTKEAISHQIARLTERHGFRPLTEAQYLDALAGERRVPSNSCLITFDDGYASVLDEAAPLLAAARVPAICYVSPGLLGAQPDRSEPAASARLDRDGVQALREYGVEIGCHSDLHASMRGMSAERLRAATSVAREEMKALFGHTPRTFAYPYGDHDAAARAAVREAGFECAFATYEGYGRFALPRVDINATDTPFTFDLKLRRLYPFVRRSLGRVPVVRRATHHVVGYAPRQP